MTLLRLADARPLLRGRRFLHRPVAARRARGHHARARRPRALGIRALPRLARRRARPAHAARPERDRSARSTGASRSTSTAFASRSIPAGHILGSAQVRVEHRGEVWVVSGDYKTEPDPTCTPFEPVRCHTFITESTFGLPIYRWTPDSEVFADIRAWWRANREHGRASRAVRVRARQGAAAARRARRRGHRAGLHARRGRAAEPRLPRERRSRCAETRYASDAAARARLRRQPDRRAAVGGGQHVAAPVRRHLDRRSRRGGCACAARGAAARSIAASCSPTTSTGRRCSPRSRRPAPSACGSRTATREPLVRWLTERGIEAQVDREPLEGRGGHRSRSKSPARRSPA